jgi:hypothetical protein
VSRGALACAASLVGVSLLGAPAGADDELEEILGGFEAERTGAGVAGSADAEHGPAAERRWRLSGLVGVEAAFPVDADRSEYEGLAKLRAEGRLQLDALLPRSWSLRLGGRGWYDFAYAIRGRDRFADDVLDAYEHELEVWESWIAGPLGERASAKLGRQITSFGTSETLRVVDLLFPLDNREPGAADLEDLYLPELQARVDMALGKGFGLTGLAILERRFSEMPPAGSSYLPAYAVLPRRDEPGGGLDDTELVLALRGRLGPLDVGVLGASVYDDLPSFEADPASPLGVRRVHDRLWMLGGVAAAARGSWVFRGELAGFDGHRFANDPGQEHVRLHALAGVDYAGFRDTTVALDVVHRWLPGAPSSIERAPDFTPRHLTELALLVRRSFLRDRLALTLTALSFGTRAELGALARLQADYAWNDALTLRAGVLVYRSGEPLPYTALGGNDRIFVGAVYRF